MRECCPPEYFAPYETHEKAPLDVRRGLSCWVRLQLVLFGKHPQAQLAQLLIHRLARRAHHQVFGTLVHREHDDFANIGGVCKNHHDPVDARSTATVGRRAVFEGLDHAAKAFLDFRGRIARDLERLVHRFQLVVADRAREDFIAVAGQVILIAQHVERIALKRRDPALGHRERVVAEVDLALIIGLIHREIDDPGKFMHRCVGQPEFFADHVARPSCDAFETGRRTAKEEGRIALAQTQLLTDRLGALGTDVFRQGTSAFQPLLTLAPEDIAHARQALFLRELVHPVAEFARAARRGGNGTDLGAVLFEQFREDRKSRVTEVIGDHLHLDRVAQIGLVRAVFQQRFGIGDARPVRIDLAFGVELFEHALQHRLDYSENIFLLDKAHLDIELVEIGGRAVGARVFIAKTRRDLEILVEPADHDQLLELLRRLRQRVEFTRMQARRHEEVARTFRAGGGDDRGLELVEPLVPHPLAHRAHHVGAQDHAVMQVLAAQIEETIGQTGFFGIVLFAEHRQRQFICLAQHFEIAHVNLDLAGRDLGVDQAVIAQLHHAIDADHPFRAHFFQRLERRAVAIAQHLRHAVMVAQVDEQHAPVVAHPVDPPGKANVLPCIGGAQIGAGMAAKGVHRWLPDRVCR